LAIARAEEDILAAAKRQTTSRDLVVLAINPVFR
jgi:hypothetical protein